MLLVWKPNWYLTYHYWPTSYNTHIFEGTCYFVPPKNARERLAPGARGGDVQGVRAPGRQHARGDAVDARVAAPVTEFPLSDQEILLRHLHKTARTLRARVRAARRPRAAGPGLIEERDMPSTLPPDFADLEPFADWALPTERERYDKRLASTMDEMQAFYDAAFPRLEDAMAYLERSRLDALPDDAKQPAAGCATRSSTSRSPSRSGASRACPTAARRPSTRCSSPRSDPAWRVLAHPSPRSTSAARGSSTSPRASSSSPLTC